MDERVAMVVMERYQEAVNKEMGGLWLQEACLFVDFEGWSFSGAGDCLKKGQRARPKCY